MALEITRQLKLKTHHREGQKLSYVYCCIPVKRHAGVYQRGFHHGSCRYSPKWGIEIGTNVLYNRHARAGKVEHRPVLMGNRGDNLSDQPGQAESYSRASQEKLLGLTVRELEVLSLLVTGKSNKEIARDLYISTSTVKSHVTSILRALDLDSRTSAAVFWTRALYEK